MQRKTGLLGEKTGANNEATLGKLR
jgi:hypothetical protein